jgi:DNA polymerase epsilon subunit 1
VFFPLYKSLTCLRDLYDMQVEAYRGQIIMPNRHEEAHGSMYDGHLLASETYVGGHVEALEAGVFRSDIPTDFKIEPSAVQQVSLSV